MPTKGHSGGGEHGQNNASSATESALRIAVALGSSQAKGMPHALYDIIFKSGNLVFCSRELKCNSLFFFSQRRGMFMWESCFLLMEGPASVAGFLLD